MIKAVVKFWGTQFNNLGMPVPYHSYLVVSSPWQSQDSGIASVVPLSTGSPLSSEHYPVQKGGDRAAFDAALKALASDPSNIGLSQHIHEG
jgi:hypothetical protein